MLHKFCKDDADRWYSGALYRPGCFATLPWGDQPFDCVVFLCDPGQAKTVREELSHELARANVDWVQVAGSGAEELHDAIDRAGVAVGRQRAVGDGSPMTSWHEEALTPEDMAEVAALCFGGEEQVLVLVVGRESDLAASAAAVKDRLARDFI
jgi:hypothetical protein